MRPTKAERKAAQRKTLSRAETVVAPAVAAFLRKRGGAVAHEIAAAYRRLSKDDAEKVRQILDDLGLDLSGLTAVMQDDLIEAYRNGGDVAVRQVLKAPAQGLFDALNPRAAAYVEKRGAALVTEIEETTRDGLKSVLEDAFTEGMSPTDLAETIRDSFEFSADRAEMIARTEMADAHVSGTLEGWKESGVVNGKSLILSNDHPGEDDCDDAAEMGVVDLDDDFGGLGDPPLHPFCECDVLPEVEAAEE